MSGQPQVAYVDDDPRLRRLIGDELHDEGVEPLICSTGQELLDLLEDRTIDLIFLDLMMPVMDGLTCLRQLRERKINVPVLIVTGVDDQRRRQECLEQGAMDYVLKPELLERLPDLLKQYLGIDRQDGWTG